MDTLTCRAPARCAACVHFDAGACALEEALNAALEPRPRAEPPILLRVDARRPAAALT